MHRWDVEDLRPKEVASKAISQPKWRPDGYGLAVIMACAIAACAREGKDLASVEQRDQQGVISVTIPEWIVRQAAVVTDDQAEQRAIPYGVVTVEEDATGKFYVLNTGDGRISVYEPDGSFVGTIGRRGRGPGEFESPVDIEIGPDESLYVLDAADARISRFQLGDGSFQSSVRLETDLGVPVQIEVAQTGAILVEFRPVPGFAGRSHPVLARVDLSSGSALPVLELDSLPQVQLTFEQGSARITRFLDAPFAPKPVWTVDPAGAILYGTGASYEVFRTTGDERESLFRVEARAERVRPSDQQEYLESHPELQKATTPVPFPETKPYFTGIRIDHDGLLWSRTQVGTRGESWDVRDPSGNLLGEVRFPRRSRLSGLTRRAIYVTVVDEEGAEALVRFDLERAARSTARRPAAQRGLTRQGV